MIVVPGRFGVRLEDHFHMTDAGPEWFTRPQHSLDDPFADVPAWPER
jgi:Xaa-Pro dipeptidase